jgi:cell division protein FtsA
MGAGTTDVALFHEGKIRHLATIGFGGNAVTNDIVQGIGVTQSDAERLKERFGCAYEPMVDPEEIIELPGTASQGERHVPREVLAHIIHQRIDEIFALVQTEIERVGYASRLSGGVVVTGGAAAMDGVAALATDVFGTGVRIGTPVDHVGGLSDSVDAPRFSTVVGLALYGANRVALAGASAAGRKRALSSPGMDRFANAVKTWLQDFF